jgi:hypothetical protein
MVTIYDKYLGIFVPTCILNKQKLVDIETQLNLFKENIDVSHDIYIIDNNGEYYKNLVEIVENNSDYCNVTIILNNTNNSEISIFKYFKNTKKYKYYLNIHDSCHLINKLPKLEHDLYYLWKTNFYVGSRHCDGYHHLKEIYDFLVKYNLNIKIKNDIENIFVEIDNDPNRPIMNPINVSPYFIFGMMFITTYDILDNVYKQICHILECNLTRRDRMCLETILGFYFYQLNKPINYIEDEPWSICKKYNFLLKQGFGR